MQIENNRIYKMENGDEYVISKSEGKWKCHLIDSDHPKGKFLIANKDFDKILEKIPSYFC